MAGRERNRYILCQAMSEQTLGSACKPEKVLFSFRQAVISLWGELGLGTFGASAKVVASFAEFSGIFVLRVPMTGLPESLSSISSMVSINSRPVTVRVIHVSGRLKNTVKAAIEALLLWRNSLPANYAVARKNQLDTQLRSAIQLLQSLPSYA